MKNRVFIRTFAVILALGPLLAAPEKMSFQTAKAQAIELHRSLIGFATPPVRAKITASAQAARTYLAKCGKACDLETFLSKDLQRRFARAGGDKLRLLEALVFAETFRDMGPMDQLNLQDTMEKQAQILQLISNISKMIHDTLKGIIQNMR